MSSIQRVDTLAQGIDFQRDNYGDCWATVDFEWTLCVDAHGNWSVEHTNGMRDQHDGTWIVDYEVSGSERSHKLAFEACRRAFNRAVVLTDTAVTEELEWYERNFPENVDGLGYVEATA